LRENVVIVVFESFLASVLAISVNAPVLVRVLKAMYYSAVILIEQPTFAGHNCVNGLDLLLVAFVGSGAQCFFRKMRQQRYGSTATTRQTRNGKHARAMQRRLETGTLSSCDAEKLSHNKRIHTSLLALSLSFTPYSP
jgi:hypothetical protein